MPIDIRGTLLDPARGFIVRDVFDIVVPLVTSPRLTTSAEAWRYPDEWVIFHPPRHSTWCVQGTSQREGRVELRLDHFEHRILLTLVHAGCEFSCELHVWQQVGSHQWEIPASIGWQTPRYLQFSPAAVSIVSTCLT